MRERLSGAGPELAASSAYLCYPAPVLREKVDDELCLAIWALFLQIKTQPVRRREKGGGIELSKGNNASNLFLPLCAFRRGEEEERRGNN